MPDSIDTKIIRERIEDLRVYKKNIKTEWEFVHGSLLTKAVLCVVHKNTDTIVVRVVFNVKESIYSVVWNPKGKSHFTFMDAPTHEDVVETINTLIAQAETPQSDLCDGQSASWQSLQQ